MSEIRHEEGTAGGRGLYWQAWRAEPARAALLFVHGLAEHSGRYLHPVGHFAPRGFPCYALDYRGHGRSSGIRVHVDHFHEFLEDVGTVHALVRERHPDLPFVLVGHSQGGLIALDYALRHPAGLAGVVVSSPFLGLHPATSPSGLTELAARLLSWLRPKTLFANHVDPRLLSSDPAVVAAYAADPLVSHTVSARWFTSLLATVAEVNGAAARLAVPALVMTAGADEVVDPEATRRWVQRTPAGLVDFVAWEGLYHELLNEPEKDQVFRRIEEWLEGVALSGSRPPAGARRSG